MTKSQVLSVTKIIGQSLDYGWTQRARIVDGLKYPLIGIVMTSLCQSFSLAGEQGIYRWALAAGKLYFFIIFSVRCHRLVLLSEGPSGLIEALKWGKRETSFLMFGLGLIIICAIISIIPVIIGLPILMKLSDVDKVVIKLVGYLFLLPGGYVVSRMSLVLPATAIDHNDNFQAAWDRSYGNGWRLFVLVCLLPIIFGPITNTLGDSDFQLHFVSAVLFPFFLFVEITVLSHIFNELSAYQSTTEVELRPTDF